MNTTRRVWILSIVGLGIASLLSSCASTTRGIMHSTRSFDEVFTVCIQSTADVHFAVTSQDRTSGFIVADLKAERLRDPQATTLLLPPKPAR